MTIEKKTVKLTVRMTDKENQKLSRWAEKSGLTKAEYLRQRAFGYMPTPTPAPVFWRHLETLYLIHDKLEDPEGRLLLEQLLLTLQTEATTPKKVTADGDY